MTVLSPYTLATRPGCYDTGSASARNTAQTVPLPANGVAYVQPIPTSGPNATVIDTCPAQVAGYPQAGDSTPYDCRAGDLFIEGTLRGKLTLAADNNVTITEDVVYQGGHGGSDVLGLVANNLVQIYHPVTCTNGTYPCDIGAGGATNLPVTGVAPLGDIQIDAAILSLRHCFTVQNWQTGPKGGVRRVFGAIAQKFGAISSYAGQTGYDDAFNYDRRLLAQPPPYFLTPEDAAWQAVKLWEQPG